MTTLPFALATIGVTLHSATAVVMALLSRAAGWRRLRWFAVVAGSAALYSGVDAWSELRDITPALARLVVRLQFVNGALHVAAWLVYTYAPETTGWRGLSARLKTAVAIVVPVAGQTIGRIREDAGRLAELSDHLSDTVEQRTAERDAARSRLVEQERLAAGAGGPVARAVAARLPAQPQARAMATRRHSPSTQRNR